MLNRGWPYRMEESALTHGARRRDVLDDFLHLCNIGHVRGMIYVSYFREIYEATDDEELRVTLDRRIYGSRYDGSGRLCIPRRGIRALLPFFPPDGVVLELKFENRAPAWMRQLVREFDLERRSVCKYCACVQTMGLQWGAPLLPQYEEALAM